LIYTSLWFAAFNFGFKQREEIITYQNKWTFERFMSLKLIVFEQACEGIRDSGLV